MKFTSTIVCATVAILVATPSFAQQIYKLSVVPPLAGYRDATANSINDLGDVAGYVNNPLNPQALLGFVIWGGVTTAVGKLAAKATFSMATYVTPSGLIIGDGDSGDGRPQGIVKLGAKVYNVFANNGGNTHAVRADAEGRIYGYFIRRGTTSWQGAMWTPNVKKAGAYTEKILGGSGLPSAFNVVGQGAGYGDAPRQTAAFWSNIGTRQMLFLQTMLEYTSSVANSIADSGDIVGSGHPAFVSLPLYWKASTGYALTELPVLPGDNNGTAFAINNAGTIVGNSFYGVPGTWNSSPEQFVVWMNGVPTPLAALLDPITNAGWTIIAVSGLNNKGQIVVNVTNGVVQRVMILTPTL